MALTSPVYLDASVLVGATVTKHRLYDHAAGAIGELFASEATILVSLLAVEESLWALARLSYCDLFNQPSNAKFSESIYRKRCSQIFEKYGERMAAVTSMLRNWSQAGVPIAVISKTEPDFLRVADLTPQHMQQYKLTPADAAHLALAQVHARTFITADSDFKEPADAEPFDDLAVVHLTA